MPSFTSNSDDAAQIKISRDINNDFSLSNDQQVILGRKFRIPICFPSGLGLGLAYTTNFSSKNLKKLFENNTKHG